MKKIVISLMTGCWLIMGLAQASSLDGIVITPKVKPTHSNIGNNIEVGIKVKDERDYNSISFINKPSNPELYESLNKKIEKQLRKIAQAKNFNPFIARVDLPEQITLSIIMDKSHIDAHLGHTKITSSVALFIEAKNHGKKYHKKYIGNGSISYDEDTLLRSIVYKWNAEKNSESFTNAYNNALEKINNDKKLWQFLAKS